MIRRSRELGLAALLVACSGCGGNSTPVNVGNAENPTKANEEMAKMYGPPKAGNSQPINAADQMRNMYNKR